MQIIHRISISCTPEIRRELASMGLSVGAGNRIASDLVTFEVDESQAEWPSVRSWLERRQPLDVVSTRFTRQEVQAAGWLELVPDWHYGYPQPRDDEFGYLDATFDLTNYCHRCGVGKVQKAPFQMKGEPKWGRRNILQLNWVFDEYFVTPEIWASVFKPHGVRSRPVLSTKLAELKTVVQLVVEEHVHVVTEGLPKEEPACSVCGRVKYLPIQRGPFPAIVEEPSGSMARTRESFGSGASANSGVIMSQALVRDATGAGIRGVSFRPVLQDGS